jgi:DNA invertase Pin-like site-specific DNA recombinase
MTRRVRVVALDLPTSWMMAMNTVYEFTSWMFEAINGMLLDMLAARNDGIARMIAAGQSWSSIQAATGCGRGTIAKIAKRAKVAA